MEELIVLIISGIAWLFGDKGKKRPPPFPPPTSAWPTPPTRQSVAPPPSSRRQPGPPPRAVPIPPMRAAVAPQRPPGPPARRKGGRPSALPAAVAVARPILTRVANNPTADVILQRSPTAGRAAVAPAATPPRTAVLRRQLTPANLRQQILLSEILRPPLALRESRDE